MTPENAPTPAQRVTLTEESASAKHPRDMTRDELITHVHDLQWAALDLAQHLACTDDLLKDEYKPAAYKRAEQMAYAIAGGQPQPTSGIQVIDERGLTNTHLGGEQS